MKIRLITTEPGALLLLPKDLLDACGLADEVLLTVRDGVLVLSASEGDRQDLDGEDQRTLAHWASLPEAPEAAELQPSVAIDAALREDPKRYGKPSGDGGA